MNVFIIAEAGVNHNGQLSIALELCDAAKEAKADAVKFQTFKTELLLTKITDLADYQKKNTGGNKTQFQMIKELELSYEDFSIIKKHCDKIGIRFLSTPDEEQSLNFLLDVLKMDIIKIGSSEVTNLPFLEKIGKKKLPVILSTGMSKMSEVALAYELLQISGASKIDLLHCTTNYPCPMEEVNLNAILTLKNAFKTNVGYSDHTIGTEVSIAAAAMGATIIEKHFTLDRQMEGPDHFASLNPKELKYMVQAIRNIQNAMGDGIKRPNKSELKIKPFIQKYIVALTKITKGDIFSEKNIILKRTGIKGKSAFYWKDLIGKTAERDYEPEEMI